MRLLLILLLIVSAYSREKSYVKEYTYFASDYDSKVTSRSKAIEQVKYLLLNEMASFIKASQNLAIVNNKQLYKEDILTVTAGITKLDILNEKWDGQTYWIKAIISVDSDDVEAKVDALLRNETLFLKFENERKKNERMMQEANMLHTEIKQLKSKNEMLSSKVFAPVTSSQISYSKPISTNDIKLARQLNYLGESAYHKKNYKEALVLYQSAIKLNPEYAQCYSNLALLYRKQGKLYDAIVIGRMAISTAKGKNARVVKASTYYNTGRIYESLGDFPKAKRNYIWALEERSREIYIEAIERTKSYSPINDYLND